MTRIRWTGLAVSAAAMMTLTACATATPPASTRTVVPVFNHLAPEGDSMMAMLARPSQG